MLDTVLKDIANHTNEQVKEILTRNIFLMEEPPNLGVVLPICMASIAAGHGLIGASLIAHQELKGRTLTRDKAMEIALDLMVAIAKGGDSVDAFLASHDL